MGQLEGKVALVTGGAKGIGRGIARRYVKEGAQVVIADIDEAAGTATCAELVALGGRASFLATDVGVREQVLAVIEHAVSEHGGLDVLVNNAIALSPNVVLEEKTDDMLDKVLHTGLWATWWAMQAALPAMRERGGGRIINLYSIDADTGAWLHSDYNLTKDAIRGLTRSAAAEWGRYNVLVNLIAPVAKGTVFAELVQAMPQFEEAFSAGNPLGRIGDPEDDIAPVAVFLAGDASRYMTGETLNVDGGQHLPRYQSKPQGL